jgi:secreted trypsin-like serine protease
MQGDSGGPLVCKKSGFNIQVGVVSFGGPSCTKSNPLVFTDTQKYMSWINQTIQTLKVEAVTPKTVLPKTVTQKPQKLQSKTNKAKKAKMSRKF